MAAKQSKKVSWFDRIRMLFARIAPAAFIVGLAVFMKSGGEAQDGGSASAGAETQPANNAPGNRGGTQPKAIYDRLTPDAVIQDRIAETSKQTRWPADAPVRRVAPPEPYRPAGLPVWTAPQTAPRAAPEPPDGYYYVSLKSSANEPAIQRDISGLSEKYKPVLGAIPVRIRVADLGAKGFVYRAAAGPLATKQEAQELCQKIKGVGGDKACFVTK